MSDTVTKSYLEDRKRLLLLRRSPHGNMFFDEVLVGDASNPQETNTSEVVEVGVQGPDTPKPNPPRLSQVRLSVKRKLINRLRPSQTVSVSVETKPEPPERPSVEELELTKRAKQMQAVSNPPSTWLTRDRCPRVSRPRDWRTRPLPLVYKAMDSEEEMKRVRRSKRWVKWHAKKAEMDKAVKNWQAAMRQRIYGPIERRRVSEEKRLRREGDTSLAPDFSSQGKLAMNMRRTAFARVRGGRRLAFRLERRLLPDWREPFDTHKEALRITL